MSDNNLEIELLKRDKIHNEEKIKNMETRLSKLDDIYVRISRYALIEKIVYTLMMSVLVGIVGLAIRSGGTMEMIKKWWFFFLVPILMIFAVMSVDTKDPVPYKDYIFYGIAQHKVVNEKLNVVFSVRGFPHKRHTTYVELVKSNGQVKFLYSEQHLGTHKAHYSKHDHLRPYKAQYKLPYLPKGLYKLRVTFEFDKTGWGRDLIVSNDIKFEVK